VIFQSDKFTSVEKKVHLAQQKNLSRICRAERQSLTATQGSWAYLFKRELTKKKQRSTEWMLRSWARTVGAVIDLYSSPFLTDSSASGYLASTIRPPSRIGEKSRDKCLGYGWLSKRAGDLQSTTRFRSWIVLEATIPLLVALHTSEPVFPFTTSIKDPPRGYLWADSFLFRARCGLDLLSCPVGQTAQVDQHYLNLARFLQCTREPGPLLSSSALCDPLRPRNTRNEQYNGFTNRVCGQRARRSCGRLPRRQAPNHCGSDVAGQLAAQCAQPA
jgi:hypothetical protein